MKRWDLLSVEVVSQIEIIVIFRTSKTAGTDCKSALSGFLLVYFLAFAERIYVDELFLNFAFIVFFQVKRWVLLSVEVVSQIEIIVIFRISKTADTDCKSALSRVLLLNIIYN